MYRPLSINCECLRKTKNFIVYKFPYRSLLLSTTILNDTWLEFILLPYFKDTLNTYPCPVSWLLNSKWFAFNGGHFSDSDWDSGANGECWLVICDWICKKRSYMYNYKYLYISKYSIYYSVSQECMELLLWIFPLMYSHPRSFCEWTLQWIASWDAHFFDSFIYQLVNITSISIGVVCSHEVKGCSDSKNYMAKDINSGCFQPHISQNLAMVYWCPVLLACFVVIPCWLSAWLGKLKLFKGHLSTHKWGLSKSRPLDF